MDSQQVFTFGQQSLLHAADGLGAAPAHVLVVGLVVSIFQAATQIHETTLSFVPKIVAAVAVLVIAGPWMLTSLVEFLQRTCSRSRPSSADRRTCARPMLTFTEAQVLAWVTPILWPFLRVLALFSALPVHGAAQRADARAHRPCVPHRVCAQAPLPPIAPVALDSRPALLWCCSRC